MTEGPSSTFQQKLAERRAREAAAAAEAASAAPQAAAAGTLFEDLIPEEQYDLTDADKQMDQAVENIDILDAYARWCGKMRPKIHRNQRENIMISCPRPGHADNEASAWVNLDKQTWFCGTCQEGGDAHDIAAFHFGYPVPEYKSDARFHELRVKMAADFGYRMETFPGGVQVLVGPNTTIETDQEEEPEAQATPASQSALPAQASPESINDAPDAQVIELYDDGDEEIIFPSIDWKMIVPENTFIWEYMKATTVDDVTEEYHFWHALIAVGFGIGRQVRLWDSVPVLGNMFVCTLGRSGAGKSKAMRHLANLVRDALPHDWSDPSSRGVEVISAVASAEMLVKSFQKEMSLDPTSPTSPKFLAPIKGLIEFNELSALIGRANRQGNALKPTLMQFYDGDASVSTVSLTSGKKEAKEPFGSALTSTQPLALKALLGRADDDSGFLNRWVFVGGPEKKRFAIGGARVDISPCIMPLQRIAGWAASFGDDDFMEWSEPAAESFTEFFHDVIEVDKRKSGSALLTRIDLLMKKIILLLSANKMEKIVSGDTVHEAIMLYEYIKQCYGVPEAQIGNTLQNEVSEAVLYQAKRQKELDGKGVTLNQLAKALKRRKYPNDLLLKVIDSLVKLGYMEPEATTAGKVGRPTVRYRYVG